jgi:hypothetical protein
VRVAEDVEAVDLDVGLVEEPTLIGQIGSVAPKAAADKGITSTSFGGGLARRLTVCQLLAAITV